MHTRSIGQPLHAALACSPLCWVRRFGWSFGRPLCLLIRCLIWMFMPHMGRHGNAVDLLARLRPAGGLAGETRFLGPHGCGGMVLPFPRPGVAGHVNGDRPGRRPGVYEERRACLPACLPASLPGQPARGERLSASPVRARLSCWIVTTVDD